MTLKLPNKIKLNHSEITLKLIESGVALDMGDQQGSYSSRTNTIYLDKEQLEGAAGVDLILHELAHCIAYQYNFEKNINEEHAVNSMATGYTEIFKRNPLLLKWINQELGKK